MSDLQRFDELKSEVAIFAAPIKEMVVTDDKSMTAALDVGKNVKSMLKKIETRRVELTKPLLEQKKSIDEYAEEIAKPLLEAEKHLKNHLGQYQIEQNKKRDAELKRIEAEKQAEIKKAQEALRLKQQEQETLAMFSEKPLSKKDQMTVANEAERLEKEILQKEKAQVAALDAKNVKNAKMVFKFEVLDPALVPIQFCSVDEKKIRAAVSSGAREIPGVRIYEDIQISIR